MSSLSQRVATRRFSFIRPNMRSISLRFLYFFLSYFHFFIRFRRHARFHVETLRKRTRLIVLADLVHRQCFDLRPALIELPSTARRGNACAQRQRGSPTAREPCSSDFTGSSCSGRLLVKVVAHWSGKWTGFFHVTQGVTGALPLLRAERPSFRFFLLNRLFHVVEHSVCTRSTNWGEIGENRANETRSDWNVA